MRDHRITARSLRIGNPWYDSKNREWAKFTCGVSAHPNCSHTIDQRTGNKK